MQRLIISSIVIILLALGSIAGLLLFASGPVQPALSFVGVSTGTLSTDVSRLTFRDRLSVHDTQLVGVASFSRVANGTHVQAYWFSPDDRRPPLGMSTIDIASGATIARFSLSSAEPWKVGPYMLQILATTKGRGDKQLVESGSLHFYIGLSEEQIQIYENEYNAWKLAAAKEQERLAEEERAKISASGALHVPAVSSSPKMR